MALLLGLALLASTFADAPASSPLTARGGWRHWWTLGVAGAFAAYVGGLLLLRRRAPATAAVVLIALVVQLAPLAAPLLLSKDLYAYWAFGRVGSVHAANPYERSPAEFPDDPAVAYVAADWVDSIPVYGPGFTLVSEAHAAVVGDSAEAAARGYRALAALAVAAVVLLVAATAARPAAAVAFVGWNPLVALHFAGGGHNDALMMVAVVGALALAARGHDRIAGASWAVAIAVKWVPVAFLALVLLAQRRPRRLSLLAGLAVALGILGVLVTARYGLAWTNAVASGRDDVDWTSSLSVQHHLQEAGLGRRVAFALPALGLLATFAWLALDAWRHRRPRLGLAAVALAISSSWLVPWYALWALALAALEDDRAGKVAAVALTAYLLLDALPL